MIPFVTAVNFCVAAWAPSNNNFDFRPWCEGRVMAQYLLLTEAHDKIAIERNSITCFHNNPEIPCP